MKVLFCGKHFEAGYLYTKEILHDLDASIAVIQCEDALVANQVVDAELLICFMHKITSDLIAIAQKLKVIMQFGVGLEGVNIPYASEKGIMVANIPGELCGNAQSCAEHAIFLALGLLRNINSIPDSIKLQKLGSPIGKTLFKSTVLIYGFGSIGKELFRRVVHFSPSEVIIIQKNSNPDSLAEFSAMDFTSLRVKVLSHEEFQQMKDHELLTEQIFICCTQNKDNLGLVNKSFLNKFRNSVNIINIARGGLLNYEDIFEAIESGKISGLGIDVFHTEPFPVDDKVLSHPKVFATPHIAGVTEVSYRTMAHIVAEQAVRIRNDESIQFVVNS